MSIVALVGLCALACSPQVERPDSVILFIGDGFGPSQMTFARNFLYGPGGGRLELESLPVTALVSTWSASNSVTDSGAGATAIASGFKADNRYVGMTADGEVAKSISEIAQEKGWKVGYVTSTTVTHATPAAFYAHVLNRYTDEDLIAEQLFDHQPDVILGGGKSSFLPESEGGGRQDGRNLLAEAKQAGYTVWERGQNLDEPAPSKLLGLFTNGHLYYTIDDRQYPEERRDPSLERLTQLALDSLSSKSKPFFLMVEGGRIDHGGHDFDAASVALQTQAFDKAVAAALKFQKQHPKTLILLTADHATGGLAAGDAIDWDGLKRQNASVSAMADRIRGSEEGAGMLNELTGYDDFTEQDADEVRQAIDGYTACRILGRKLAERTGVTWLPKIGNDTYGHTGEDVPLFAGGPGAERFQGILDNTDIPKILRQLLAWD